MNRSEVFEVLTKIFQNQFDDDEIVLTDDTSSKDIDEWDSLEQLVLIETIKNTFNISFSIDEANSMKNIGEMVNYIMEKSS